MYGFKEAANYWYKTLTDVFIANGYKRCFKDGCALWKREGDKIAIAGVTVDDCMFAGTRNAEWKKQQVAMLSAVFGELTFEDGDVLQIVGMKVVFDRVLKAVEISQPNYVLKLSDFGIDKGAASPATADFFFESDEDKLLDSAGQSEFRSLNAYLMYGAKRTYPEISLAVVTLSKKYNKATERDMKKVLRVAQYVYGCSESHCLRLQPKSLQLVAMSDASDGINSNGRGQSGGVIGFESDSACWVSWVCKTQPVVAQSSGEAELIAVNTVGNMVEWSKQLMEELGFAQQPIVIYQDSECSLKMLKKGTGSFKRAKHIKIRYFWLKELIDAGEVVMRYIPTSEMVADIFTKAITGAQFYYLCSLLLGWVKVKKGHVASEEVCRD
jgi:hypothetical protein